MKHWFKLPDDSVTNLRFLSISRKVGQSPAVVSFVYIAAMSCASASESNGSLRDFHAEDIDAFGGLEDGTTASIIEALTAAGMITEDGCIADWETTQSVPTEEAVEDRRAYKREWARRKREESRMADSPASGQPVDSCRQDVDASGQPVDSCRHHKEKIREDKIRDLKHTPLTPQGETQGVGVSTPAQTSSPLKARETPRPDPEQKPEPPAADPPQAPDTTTDPATPPQADLTHGNPAWKEFCYLYSLWPVQQGKEKAWREYAYLRARHLVPESYALAEVIDRFKAEDRKWKRNYVPLMANWLRDRRWDDQPDKAPAPSYAPDENGRTPYVNEAEQDYSQPSRVGSIMDVMA
nr:MAG TPA: replisome organizer [Caudoviricetes sp.]